jgi:hypothetical protein
MDDNVVRSSLLDNRYIVTVDRAASYQGELTIAGGKLIMHRQAVGLIFDSIFGPDVDVVRSSQGIAIEFVDDQAFGHSTL